MSAYILVVDDEPDVESLFRQQFRRDLRSGRFHMEFAPSAPIAIERATEIGDPSLILILSDINMPGMSGLEMLPQRHGHFRHAAGSAASPLQIPIGRSMAGQITARLRRGPVPQRSVAG